MFQKGMRKIYWRCFVLISLAAALIALHEAPPTRADSSCMACDANYYDCTGKCNTGDPAQDQACVNSCQEKDSQCTNFCTEAMTTYHYYEFDSGYSNHEHQYCLQMGHRAGYRRCFNGNPLYPDEYNACIAGGSTVEDCCLEQESLYDNENCVPF